MIWLISIYWFLFATKPISESNCITSCYEKYPWKVCFNKTKYYDVLFCRFSESKLRIFRLVKSLILQTCVLHMRTCFLKYVVAMSSRYYPGLRIRVEVDRIRMVRHPPKNRIRHSRKTGPVSKKVKIFKILYLIITILKNS